MFLFIFEREREHKLGTSREGDAESEAGSRLSAWSPKQGSNSGNCEILT